MKINETHNPDLVSWVASANAPDNDFPVQNLPFGVFCNKKTLTVTVGIAIGDMILDVNAAANAGLYNGLAEQAARQCNASTLNGLMALGAEATSALRQQTSRLLRADTAEGQHAQTLSSDILVSMADAEMRKPVAIGDYSDFTASVYHATNMSNIFNPGQPQAANYKYVPIAYHGRTSSIFLSGTPVIHPTGQFRLPGETAPIVAPSRRFDYELELGVYVGKGNAYGKPIAIDDAADHLFGVSLVNDWSARDIQGWEMQPLGPFLSKSTITSVAAWVITMEALAPFHAPAFARAEGDPKPLPHLYSANDQQNGNLAITLEIHFSTAQMRQQGIAPIKFSRTSSTNMYWTPQQLLTHHTSNGCNMQVGDLFASGTLSGATADARACLYELTWGGRDLITLPTGEKRALLEDGDEVILSGYCEREGYHRIGLGECRGVLVPAT
ncbi:MAG: fumarylacetoacetase [Anaerolineae bacterium]|nr:fumarylacetoacetase [Anaerolineae bacterium]